MLISHLYCLMAKSSPYLGFVGNEENSSKGSKKEKNCRKGVVKVPIL